MEDSFPTSPAVRLDMLSSGPGSVTRQIRRVLANLLGISRASMKSRVLGRRCTTVRPPTRGCNHLFEDLAHR